MPTKPLPSGMLATPEMLITKEVGSDSYVGFCVEVSGKKATFQVGNRRYVCSLRKDGLYREVGSPSSERHIRWLLGIAVAHLDPHF